MDFTESEMIDAKSFGEFFVEKMENCQNTMNYYFSEDIILDWFGQTIKGEKNVTIFLKKTFSSVNHILPDYKPARKIGFRDAHKVKVPRIPKAIPIGLMSPPRIMHQKTLTKTPKKQIVPSTSAKLNDKIKSKEHGQGDGFHNNNNSTSPEVSPAKKLKSSKEDSIDDVETVEEESDCSQHVKYMVSEGFVEFHKPSNKKLQSETKWKRPCKLSVAYSKMTCSDYTIYLIIYEGNMKCRRNLMKDFEAEEPEN